MGFPRSAAGGGARGPGGLRVSGSGGDGFRGPVGWGGHAWGRGDEEGGLIKPRAAPVMKRRHRARCSEAGDPQSNPNQK